MKKILSLICIVLTISMISSLAAFAAPVEEPTDVTEKFVDETFRNKILELIGKEAGDRIYDTDLSGIKTLSVSSKQITDISGIEYFVSLEDLDVGYCSLTALDVSSLKNLKMLNCYENNISELEICGLTELTGIVCYNNHELTKLTISDLPSLIFLSCFGTEITSLDLSGTPSLEELSCERTNIRELDISECPNMRLISADIANKWTIRGYDQKIEYNPTYRLEDPQDDTGLPFRDVKKSDWFFENVEYMYNNKLMNGTSEVSFEPGAKMTRAMSAMLLYRFFKNRFHFTEEAEEKYRTDENFKTKFTDVPENSWYTAAVNYLTSSEKVIKGKTEKIFAPDDNVTRAELAAMLYRIAESSTSYIEISDERGLPADFDSVPSFARDAVSVLYKAGVIMGRPGDIVDPHAFVTRAEAAAMYERCMKVMRTKVTPEPTLTD